MTRMAQVELPQTGPERADAESQGHDGHPRQRQPHEACQRRDGERLVPEGRGLVLGQGAESAQEGDAEGGELSESQEM